MTESILARSCLLLWPRLEQKERVDLLASVMIDWACVAPLILVGGLLPYGRYSGKNTGKIIYVKAKLGWILQVTVIGLNCFSFCC